MVVVDVEHVARLVNAKGVVVSPEFLGFDIAAFDHISGNSALAECFDEKFIC